MNQEQEVDTKSPIPLHDSQCKERERSTSKDQTKIMEQEQEVETKSPIPLYDSQHMKRKRLMSKPQTNPKKCENLDMVNCFLNYSMKYTGREHFVNFCRDNILFTGSWKDFVFRRDILDEFYKYCGGCKLSPVGLGMHLCSAGVKTTRLGKEYGQEYGYSGICFKDNRGRRYFPQKRPRSNPKMVGAWTSVIGTKEKGCKRKVKGKKLQKIGDLELGVDEDYLPGNARMIDKHGSTLSRNNDHELENGETGKENTYMTRSRTKMINKRYVVSTSSNLDNDGKTGNTFSSRLEDPKTIMINEGKNDSKIEDSEYEVIWIENDTNSGSDNNSNSTSEAPKVTVNSSSNDKKNDEVSSYEIIWIINDSNSENDNKLIPAHQNTEMSWNSSTKNSKIDDGSDYEQTWKLDDIGSMENKLISRTEEIEWTRNTNTNSNKIREISRYEQIWRQDNGSSGEDNLIFQLDNPEMKAENGDQSCEITSTTLTNDAQRQYLDLGCVPQTHDSFQYITPQPSMAFPDYSSFSMQIPDCQNMPIDILDYQNHSIPIQSHQNLSIPIPDRSRLSIPPMSDNSSSSIPFPDYQNSSIFISNDSSSSTLFPDQHKLSIPIQDQSYLPRHIPDNSIHFPDQPNPYAAIPEIPKLSRSHPDQQNISTHIPDDDSRSSTSFPYNSKSFRLYPDRQNVSSNIPEHPNLSIPITESRNSSIPSCIEEWIYPTPFQVLDTSQASVYNYYVLPQIDTQYQEQPRYEGGIEDHLSGPQTQPQAGISTYDLPRYDAGTIASTYQLPTQAQVHAGYHNNHHHQGAGEKGGFQTQGQAQANTNHHHHHHHHDSNTQAQFKSFSYDLTDLVGFSCIGGEEEEEEEDKMRVLTAAPQDIDIDLFDELDVDKKYFEL